MASAAYAPSLRTFASYTDDPLFHSPTVTKATSTTALAMRATVSGHDPGGFLLGRSVLSPACSTCEAKPVKPVKIETAEKQQQVVVLEPFSNPRVTLLKTSHGLTDVESGRLSLPWLVSDAQFSSREDHQLDANPNHVLFQEEPSPSELDASRRQVTVRNLVNGFPVASQINTSVLSTTPSAAPAQKHENPGRDEYHVNTGYAIRSLREELPSLFYKDLNYEFYREDIVFRDPLNIFHGIRNYKLIFWALRFHGQIFFKAIWVDVLSVWQPSERVITVRWAVRGIPRVPWEAQGRFDGTSEYKLDKDGKIYEHKVHNVVVSSPPKVKPLTVMDLVRVAGVQTTPTPTCFFRVLFLLGSLVPFLEQFTWVRFYLALESTVALLGLRRALISRICVD